MVVLQVHTNFEIFHIKFIILPLSFHHLSDSFPRSYAPDESLQLNQTLQTFIQGLGTLIVIVVICTRSFLVVALCKSSLLLELVMR